MNHTIQTIPLNSLRPMLASGRLVLISGELDYGELVTVANAETGERETVRIDNR